MLTLPPLQAHTGFATGAYYTTPIGSTTGTQLLTQNRIYYWPFIQSDSKGRAFDRIAVDITTGAADATAQIRYAIYTSVNGRPSALVLDAGLVTIGTNTGNQAATIAQTLAPGAYFLAIVSNKNGGAGAMATLRSAANEARFFANYLQGLGAPSEVQNCNLLFQDETIATWSSYVYPATPTGSALGSAGTLPVLIFLRAT